MERATAAGEPVFITQHRSVSAVLVSVGAYERAQHDLEILCPLARGKANIEVGIDLDLETVMAEADALLGES